MRESFLDTLFFLLGFTPCKAEQPLQGMESIEINKPLPALVQNVS